MLQRVVLLFLFAFACISASWFDNIFHPQLTKMPQFPSSALYSVDIGLGSFDGFIGGFGDMNSDQHTDVFLISSKRDFVIVYLWDNINFVFTPLESSKLTPEGLNITHITPSDYNYDGMLDILISGSNEEHPEIEYLTVYYGNLKEFVAPLALPSASKASGHVLALDANADMQVDLFGMSIDGQRAFWINKNVSFTLEAQSGSNLPPLEGPTSHAFVDLDGDCASDLFVTSGPSNSSEQRYFEIWINNFGSFTLHSKTPAPPGAGQVVFADFNRDGTMDALFPVCYPAPTCDQENSIRLYLNVQKPLCSFSFWIKQDNCRLATDLCEADPNFQLFQTTPVILGSTDLGYPDYQLAFDPLFGTLTVHQGDYNMDGFPDILVPLANVSNVHQTNVHIFQNVLATSNAGFVHVTEGTNALESIPNAFAATFFDFGDNGMSHILVIATPPPENDTDSMPLNSEKFQIYAIFNNFQNDAFFLKALGLNGVCPEFCSGSNQFPDPKPYGVNYPGASFKFTVTDIGGTKRVTQGVQYQQSGYWSLQSPYLLFGLGRTNNYVEEFYLGVTTKEKPYANMWPGIIPNSQLVAFPYGESTSWSLEMYIRTSGVDLWVFIAVISGLLVAGIGIAVFKWREVKADRAEKEQEKLFQM